VVTSSLKAEVAGSSNAPMDVDQMCLLAVPSNISNELVKTMTNNVVRPTDHRFCRLVDTGAVFTSGLPAPRAFRVRPVDKGFLSTYNARNYMDDPHIFLDPYEQKTGKKRRVALLDRSFLFQVQTESGTYDLLIVALSEGETGHAGIAFPTIIANNSVRPRADLYRQLEHAIALRSPIIL